MPLQNPSEGCRRVGCILLAVSWICWFAFPSTVFALQEQKNIEAEVPATVRGIWSVELYSKVGGYVEAIHVDIGDSFEEGDLLIQLKIPELESDVKRKEAMLQQSEAEVQQAQAVVREAEAALSKSVAAVDEARSIRLAKNAQVEYESRELDRISRLVESDSVSPELVETGRLKLESARADLETVAAMVATAKADVMGSEARIEKAKADVVTAAAKVAVARANLEHSMKLLEYSTIVAPWSGKVIERNFDVGGFVQNADGNSAARPILKIARVDRVRVTFMLSSSELVGVDKGNRVVFGRIDALPGAEFEGTITRLSAGVSESTRSMQVEVELDNPAGRLKPGFFGYVRVYPK